MGCSNGVVSVGLVKDLLQVQGGREPKIRGAKAERAAWKAAAVSRRRLLPVRRPSIHRLASSPRTWVPPPKARPNSVALFVPAENTTYYCNDLPPLTPPHPTFAPQPRRRAPTASPSSCPPRSPPTATTWAPTRSTTWPPPSSEWAARRRSCPTSRASGAAPSALGGFGVGGGGRRGGRRSCPNEPRLGRRAKCVALGAVGQVLAGLGHRGGRRGRAWRGPGPRQARCGKVKTGLFSLLWRPPADPSHPPPYPHQKPKVHPGGDAARAHGAD
jgi:hypothetical protein